jgi:hypothetical protein
MCHFLTQEALLSPRWDKAVFILTDQEFLVQRPPCTGSGIKIILKGTTQLFLIEIPSHTQ